VIAGRTIDLSFALTLASTSGSIILTVIDPNGAVISGIRPTVTNVATGMAGASPTDQAGRAVFSNLPPGQYDIVAGTAEAIASLNGVIVTAGEPVQITLKLSSREQARPKTFVEFKALKNPPLGDGQFGMVFDLEGKAVQFEDSANNLVSRAQAKQTARSEEVEAKKSYTRKYVEGRGVNEHVLQPWLSMTKIEPMPSNVRKWLLEWWGYFAEGDSRIGKKNIEPAIFVNGNYTPPKSINDIPSEPQAYAVFGDSGAPLLVLLDEAITMRPVEIKKIKPPLLWEPIWEMLEQNGIIYLDQFAALDYPTVAKVLDQPEEVARLEILYAFEQVEEINANRRYYDGMDDQVNGVLNALGLKDDVAIANADPSHLAGELSQRLDDAGEPSLSRKLQAQQLVSQAREIVEPEAWSLEFAGFTAGQAHAMVARGIVSKGDLVNKIASDEARAELAKDIGLSRETIANLQNTALKQLTASSLSHGVSKNLLALSGVNATIAATLGKANLDTVEKVAAASEEEIVNATGFSADWAAKLKTNALAASSGGKELSSLASISDEEAETLARAGISKVIDLKNKDAGTIAEFINKVFGDKPQQAATVLEKLAPIFKGGAI
jgi:hypothetical protein